MISRGPLVVEPMNPSGGRRRDVAPAELLCYSRLRDMASARAIRLFWRTW